MRSKSSPMYIYKRRACLGMGKPSMYRPRGRMTFGKWQRVCDYATLAEAHSHQLRDSVGLYDRAVFHKGRRLTDSNGRLI